MSYLSDAHSEWHFVNPDEPWNCPLDCGMAEPDPWDDMTDEDIAEYEAWAAQLPEPVVDPWADADFLPGGPDFDPPF